MHNPLIHRDRRLGQSESDWVRSFGCEDMTVLIVCRGPIRQEALDIFEEMGMAKVGILLSEKDSIVYPRALAPELRRINPSRVHAVSDYTGASKEERTERIAQIISIAKGNGYDYIFAGYGFMAEDEEFVRSIEEAGLRFIGPCSHTVQAAGFKDEAKRTAEQVDVSVTPGINNATARLLLRKFPDRKALKKLAKKQGLDVAELGDDGIGLETVADAVLGASYDAGIDLYTVDELAEQIQIEVASIVEEYEGSRIRLKAIGGGGGKGQRIVDRADQAPPMVREILSEVKALGVGDNKNILVELNIETTRHNEIQLLGNGEWTVSLGGRDCSLQMHEQKLLEVSITQETLGAAVERERAAGNETGAAAIEQDLQILRRMEEEAERFGEPPRRSSASSTGRVITSWKSTRAFRSSIVSPSFATRSAFTIPTTPTTFSTCTRSLKRWLCWPNTRPGFPGPSAFSATPLQWKHASMRRTSRFLRTQAARSCPGRIRSRARFATTRESVSRTPIPICSCATSWRARMTATSRSWLRPVMIAVRATITCVRCCGARSFEDPTFKPTYSSTTGSCIGS
jgi:biotin carboxylase